MSNKESNEAFGYQNSSGKAARDRQIVLRCVLGAGSEGRTRYEVEKATGLLHQTAGPRLKELLDEGLIIESNKRRPTDTGRAARVLVGPEWKPRVFGKAKK